MGLFEYVCRHAKAVLFSVAVFVVSGIALMFNMPISLFPDITFPRIVVLADNGEEPAERMMVEVTKPLEEVATSIPGVRSFAPSPVADRQKYLSGWIGVQMYADAAAVTGTDCKYSERTSCNGLRSGRTDERVGFSDSWIQPDFGYAEPG